MMFSFRRRALTALLPLLCLALMVQPVFAVPVASYDFANSGELDGAGGGAGFSGNWSAQTGITEQVPAPATFSYTVPGGGSVAPVGALQVTGNNDNAATRALATPQTGDVYFSFLTNWDAGNIDQNDFASWFFNSLASTNPNIGWRGNQNTGTATNPDLFARSAINGEAHTTDNAAIGETFFVVGHAYKTGSGNYNRYEIWVNPAFGDFAAPDATSTNTSGTDTISSLGLRSVNLDGGDEVLFGDLRLGTSWRDVVPAAAGALNPGLVALTADADAYARSGGSAGTNFGNDPLLQVKTDLAPTGDNNRKAWVRFDTSGVDMTQVTGAELELTVAPFVGVVTDPDRIWTFNVWGLRDDHMPVGSELSENWLETSLNYGNAPGNANTGGDDVDLSDVFGGLPLATFSIVGAGAVGDVISIDDQALLDFLMSDTNGISSFILTRNEQGGSSSDTVVHQFFSSESTDGTGPRLLLTSAVPEPSAALLGLIAAATLGLRRRRVGCVKALR